MKNKKNIYILLPIVLLVWGLVIYQFFSFGNEGTVTEMSETNLDIKPITLEKRDSTAISVHYRDPFLGKMYAPVQGGAKKTGKRKEPIEKEAIIWPNIVYKGLVSDAKDKKKVFMVILNGRTFLMREKQTEQDVTLTGGNRDRIDVRYKGNAHTILIQQ